MSGDRSVAVAALRHYEVVPQRVRLAAVSFNSVFRVTSASEVCALRVSPARQIHAAGTAAVEAAWHERLRQQGTGVPGVRANADGQVETVVPDTRGEPRACVLFDWVTGRSPRTMTGPSAAALGRLSARLHRDAAAWSPPGAGNVLAADRVLYWRLPDLLAAAGSQYGAGALFADAAARAQLVIDELWRDPPHPPRLMHGDLTPSNVIVSPARGLVPIDFQDVVRGFEIQDLAITVAALRRWPDGAALAATFCAGYREDRAWPDVSPARFESLIAARHLHTMNFTLNLRGLTGQDRYVADRAGRIRAWLRHPAG